MLFEIQISGAISADVENKFKTLYKKISLNYV